MIVNQQLDSFIVGMMGCLNGSLGFHGKIFLCWKALFWIVNAEMAMTMRSILNMLHGAVDPQLHWS